MNRDQLAHILSITTDHVLLFGPRGTAKTTTAVSSARPGQTVFQVTLTNEGSAASLLGHYIPKGGDFIWHPGPFQRAWEEGGLLIINELDHASEDVSNLLHAILDDGLGAYLTLPTGETIMPGKTFRAICTQNGVPEDLAPAVLDRLRIRIPVTMPSQEQLDSLDPDIRETCKNLYEAGTEATTFRMLSTFNKLRAALGPKDAAFLIFGDQSKGDALLKAIELNKTAVKAASGKKVSLSTDGVEEVQP